MSAIAEAFERLVRELPDRMAIWSRGEGVRLSFGQMAEHVAAWRSRLDLLPSGAVALAVGNCSAFVTLFLALRSANRPVVSVDATLDLPEKIELCRRWGVPVLLHRGAEGVGLANGVHALHVEPIAGAAVPVGTDLVKTTSGSTGDPVGICLTETELLVGVRQIVEGMQIEPDDQILVAIPLSHSYGFDSGVLSLVVIGTPLILEPSFYPAPLLRALAESEANVFPAVAPLIRCLGETDWPTGLRLRTVISAGGPLVPEIARRFAERSGLAVHQFYGSTETGGISFERFPEEPGALGTVGRPLPGVEITLRDGGRVEVRSAANYRAYVHETRLDAEPRTVLAGDTASWNADGRLRLTGRASAMLNVGGRKIAIAAVESALRNLPGVREAAVIGIADPLRGDRSVAFLVAEHDTVTLRGLPADLTPREVRFLPELPYTGRGKLDRSALRRLAEAKP